MIAKLMHPRGLAGIHDDRPYIERNVDCQMDVSTERAVENFTNCQLSCVG